MHKNIGLRGLCRAASGMAAFIAALSLYPIYGQTEGSIVIDNFTPGLNSHADPFVIKDNEASDCNNIKLDDTDVLESRGGSVIKATCPYSGAVLSMYEFNESGGKQWLVVQVASTAYATEDYVTWNMVWAGCSVNEPLNYAVSRNRLWMVNGIDSPHTWNYAQGVSTISITKGRYICVNNDTVYISGNYTSPNMVYFSQPGSNPELSASWITTNAFSINADDGDIITAILAWLGRILVFKSRSMYYIMGTDVDNAVIGCISNQTGCIDGATAINIENSIYFVSRRGIETYGGAGIQFLGGKVYDEFKATNNYATPAREWRINSSSDMALGTCAGVEVSSGVIAIQSTAKKWETGAQFGECGLLRVTTQAVSDCVTVTTSANATTKWLTLTSPDFRGNRGMLTGVNAANAVDGDSGTAVAITLAPRWYTYNWQRGTSYKLYNGDDKLDIVIPLGAYYTVRQVNWAYSFGDETYFSRVFPRLAFLDALSAKYVSLYPQTRPNAYWYRTDVIDNPDGTYTEGSYTGYTWYRTNDPISTAFAANSWIGSYATNAYTNLVRIQLLVYPGTVVGETIEFKLHEITVNVNDSAPAYNTSGVITSDAWSVGVGRRLGTFSASISTPTGTSIQFAYSTGTNGSTWGNWNLIAPGGNMDVVAPYARWCATMTVTDQTLTPTIYDVTMNALDSTGTFISPSYQPSGLQSWGSFITDDVANDQTISYFIRSSDTLAHMEALGWTAITPGNTIAQSTVTANFVQWKSSYTIVNGSCTAYTNGVTVRYYSGPRSDRLQAQYTNNRYYTAAARLSTSTHNDTLYVMDADGAMVRWTPGPYVSILGKQDNTLFYGDATGHVWQIDTGSDDNGVSANPCWQSKDMAMGAPYNDKHIQRIELTGVCTSTTVPVWVSYRPAYRGGDWSNYAFYFSSSGYTSDYAYLNTSGERVWQFKIWTSSAGATWKVRTLGITYLQEPWR